MSALVQELEEHYLQDSLQFCLSSFLFIVSIISDQNDTNKFLLIWDSLEMYVCILAPSPPTFSLIHLECICFPVLLWLCQTQRAFTVWWQGQVSRAMGLGPGKSVFLFSYMRAALSISFHFPAKKTLSAGSFLVFGGGGWAVVPLSSWWAEEEIKFKVPSTESCEYAFWDQTIESNSKNL